MDSMYRGRHWRQSEIETGWRTYVSTNEEGGYGEGSVLGGWCWC